MSVQEICRVAENTQLGDGLFLMVLHAPKITELAQCGQFVHIACGEGHLLRRPISICTWQGSHLRIVFQVKGDGTITQEIAIFSLQALNIDQYGLDEIDNKILLTIIDKFRGGPVGISTIATAIGEDSGTVEEVYEPYLIMEGFLKRTPRGRVATQLAYEHLGRNPYAGNVMQPDLFD